TREPFARGDGDYALGGALLIDEQNISIRRHPKHRAIREHLSERRLAAFTRVEVGDLVALDGVEVRGEEPAGNVALRIGAEVAEQARGRADEPANGPIGVDPQLAAARLDG